MKFSVVAAFLRRKSEETVTLPLPLAAYSNGELPDTVHDCAPLHTESHYGHMVRVISPSSTADEAQSKMGSLRDD